MHHQTSKKKYSVCVSLHVYLEVVLFCRETWWVWPGMGMENRVWDLRPVVPPPPSCHRGHSCQFPSSNHHPGERERERERERENKYGRSNNPTHCTIAENLCWTKCPKISVLACVHTVLGHINKNWTRNLCYRAPLGENWIPLSLEKNYQLYCCIHVQCTLTISSCLCRRSMATTRGRCSPDRYGVTAHWQSSIVSISSVRGPSNEHCAAEREQ